jgi:hypothetical protein
VPTERGSGKMRTRVEVFVEMVENRG